MTWPLILSAGPSSGRTSRFELARRGDLKRLPLRKRVNLQFDYAREDGGRQVPLLHPFWAEPIRAELT